MYHLIFFYIIIYLIYMIWKFLVPYAMHPHCTHIEQNLHLELGSAFFLVINMVWNELSCWISTIGKFSFLEISLTMNIYYHINLLHPCPPGLIIPHHPLYIIKITLHYLFINLHHHSLQKHTFNLRTQHLQQLVPLNSIKKSVKPHRLKCKQKLVFPFD